MLIVNDDFDACLSRQGPVSIMDGLVDGHVIIPDDLQTIGDSDTGDALDKPLHRTNRSPEISWMFLFVF